jgi:hypothetical protein
MPMPRSPPWPLPFCVYDQCSIKAKRIPHLLAIVLHDDNGGLVRARFLRERDEMELGEGRRTAP